ncbi:lipocalin family protein [Jejudonia soesokkakensis]|uniref:Lipocalin family protein n=1 Tax=Jejudonia soesokkakensis TaxID=1323432 RepID=A0ABW2MQC3_9FLAO
MKKILITFILTFQIGILIAQKSQSELLLGTWRFEKELDLRNNAEKSKYEEIPWCPYETESGTGYPDLTFKKDNLFERYFTKEHIEYGKWEIKNNEILIYRLIQKEKAKKSFEFTKRLLKRKLIFKGTDGNYYFKPHKLKIKNLLKNKAEFGNNKEFEIYKRIK